MRLKLVINVNFKSFVCTGFNQTASNDLNENDIVEKSKIAHIGQFNDISNGNTSTIFLGGIVFPKDFDYDDSESMNCNTPRCAQMSYTIRLGYKYTQPETDTLYSKGAGQSNSGRKYCLML